MDDRELLRVEVTLELQPNADPPCGRLVSKGVSYPFGGWLGFALALERVIDAERYAQRETPRSNH